MKGTHSLLVSEVCNLTLFHPFPSWQRPGSLYSIKTKLSQLGEERRGGLSFPGMSPRFGSPAPLGLHVSLRAFWPHCKSLAGVYMSAGADLFSSHFFPCLSHLRFLSLSLSLSRSVVPPLSLTPHVSLAQRLGSWTERLLNLLTAQFVNAAPGYFRPLG